MLRHPTPPLPLPASSIWVPFPTRGGPARKAFFPFFWVPSWESWFAPNLIRRLGRAPPRGKLSVPLLPFPKCFPRRLRPLSKHVVRWVPFWTASFCPFTPGCQRNFSDRFPIPPLTPTSPSAAVRPGHSGSFYGWPNVEGFLCGLKRPPRYWALRSPP